MLKKPPAYTIPVTHCICFRQTHSMYHAYIRPQSKKTGRFSYILVIKINKYSK